MNRLISKIAHTVRKTTLFAGTAIVLGGILLTGPANVFVGQASAAVQPAATSICNSANFDNNHDIQVCKCQRKEAGYPAACTSVCGQKSYNTNCACTVGDKAACQALCDEGVYVPQCDTTKPTPTNPPTKVNPPTSQASSCTPQDASPETNILYCGLPSTTDAKADLSTLNKAYMTGDDKNGGDITSIYAAAGLTKAKLADTHNWVIGTSYNDGTLKVNGKLVGEKVQIASRCVGANGKDLTNANNNGYCKPASRHTFLASNAFTHDATWFFDTSSTSKPTLIHLNSDGVADFAAWVACSNVLIVTAPPVVHPTLVCQNLTATGTDDLVYTFKVTVTNSANQDVNYSINFGDTDTTYRNTDGTNVTNTSATFTHTYNRPVGSPKTYTATVTINGQSQVDACKKPITIPGTSFACLGLTATQTASTKETLTYDLKANASGVNDTAVSYTFYENGQQIGASTTGELTHNFTIAAHKVIATATSKNGVTTSTANTLCAASITATPPELPHTGANMFGLAAITSVIGAGAHQLLMRRRP